MAGIDLGTSNSALAIVENGQPTIIRPNMLDDILPSAVFIEKSGTVTVGAQAVKCMLGVPEEKGSGHSRWKPRMGQDDRYHFAAARKTLTGPELSALVIKELLRAYAREKGEELESCVITIPAKFDQAANEATREAGRLAGLKYFPTLQEPIAAALAYGFTSNDSRANWMIFDLGGGTLDVSLMVVRHGSLVVLKEGQAGDPNLGGSNFDRELLDFVLGPAASDTDKWECYRRLQSDYAPLRKRYRLESFGEQTHRTAWFRLMMAVEQAKIELSRKPSAVVELNTPLLLDEAGCEVQVEVPVTREAYEKLIAVDVARAVNICETLLRRNRLAGTDVDQMILIGGPTKTPFIQTILAERLKIQLDVRIDPMTAVALGAALHAETLDLPAARRRATIQRMIPIDVQLQYDPSSKTPLCTVAGVLECEHGLPPGLTVEMRRADDLWASGAVPVDETGFFTVDVMLVERGSPHQSRFTTVVADANGRTLATVDEPRIWHPLPEAKATLANSLSIALAGNDVLCLVEQGTTLPAQKKETVQTTKTIRRGSSEDVLVIPVVEAVESLLGREEREHADCSMHVGQLLVRGSNTAMTSDLPRGSEVDVTLRVNESRETTVIAYVPLLDEEFEAQLKIEPYGMTIDGIEIRFLQEKRRLEQIRRLQAGHPIQDIESVLDLIDRLDVVHGLETELARAKAGEGYGLSRAWRRVLELAATLHSAWREQTRVRVADRLERLALVAVDDEAKDVLNLRHALARIGPQDGQPQFRQLEEEIDVVENKVRNRPFFSLLLRCSAMAGRQGPTAQVEVGNRAIDLCNSLLEAGAPETLTASDLERVTAMNRELEGTIPDLPLWVDEYCRQLPDSMSPMDAYGSTVRKRG